MKLKLLSDYTDWYDSLFDVRPTYNKQPDPELKKYLHEPFYNLKDEETFVRICNAGLNPSRRWCFEKMAELGENVIPYGNASDIVKQNGKAVVYTDEYLHAGRGKYVMDEREIIGGNGAYLGYQQHLASKFIKTDEKVARSHKYLQIGMNAFIIQMTSFNDWRTNAGQIECEVLKFWQPEPTPRVMHRCLWAIDYVTDIEAGETYAIDYNMAPGCTSLGVKDHLTATQVVRGIKDWYRIKEEMRNGSV